MTAFLAYLGGLVITWVVISWLFILISKPRRPTVRLMTIEEYREKVIENAAASCGVSVEDFEEMLKSEAADYKVESPKRPKTHLRVVK